jgi:glycosyltransferase involved in cell wall biosynthesis
MQDNEIPCSILLPIYNGSKFLQRSILSNLLTMRPFDELLIINDGSEDISPTQLLEMENIDRRIHVINKAHTGLVETLNYGISCCQHEFIARADIDDLYDKNRIEIQMREMLRNIDYGAIFSDYTISTFQGQKIGTIPTAIFPTLTTLSLINPSRTPHPSVIYRKSKVLEVGGYLKSDFPAEDLSLWMRISQVSNIATVPEFLLNYTRHRKSITSNHQDVMTLKSKELVMKFVSHIPMKEVLAHGYDIASIYENYPESTARILLFYRDFLRLCKYSNHLDSSFLIKNLSLFKGALQIDSVPVIFQKFKEKLMINNFN